MNILGKRDKFTLRSICKAAGIEVPEAFQDKADEAISLITCFGNRVRKDGALFIRGLLEDGKTAPRDYKEKSARVGYQKGARFIFSTEQYYAESGEPLPCVIVEDPRKLFLQLCQGERDKFSPKMTVIGITGSVGKTTTTEMVALVSEKKGKTFYSKQNSNGFASIAHHIQEVSRDNAVYVQEVGAYFPGLIEEGASMLQPNACIVTNIGTSHVDYYGSVENIMHDKLALARHMRDGGMAFLNYDDPMLRSAKLDCPVTWFSFSNPEADFYAENITYTADHLEYDVVGKNQRQRIKLYSYGIHNIIDSVSAFAFGSWLGLNSRDIADALAEYKTSGIRQNLCNIGGYRLYIDCFNSAPNSLLGAVETISRIPVDAGNQRIAVLGDMLKMGSMAKELHISTGKELAQYPIDLYLCYGPYMRYMADELKKAGRRVLYTESRRQLNTWIWQYAKLGDLILFKAGHRMQLSKTIDQVFGTAFYLTDPDVLLEKKKVFKTTKVSGVIVDDMVEVRSGTITEGTLEIPSTVKGLLMTRIAAEAFSRSSQLKKLVIRNGLTNIGVAAFYICTNLTEIVLPSTLKNIERSAFNYCTKLKEVVVPDSVIHIGKRAFYDCRSLEKIVIGENTAFIGAEAFRNCPKLTIYGVSGSYAERYAQAEGIPFRSLSDK